MSNKYDEDRFKLEKGQRLRFIRTLSGMTAKAFAHICGVGYTTINCWEKGVNSLTEKGAQRIVTAMQNIGVNCTISWLLRGQGELPTIEQQKFSRFNYNTIIPPISQLAVQEGTLVYDKTSMCKEIEQFKALHTAHLISVIQDESMSPIYQPGDWVGGPSLLKENLELAHQKNCVVKFRDGNLLIYRVQVDNILMGRLNFYVLNPEFSFKYPALYQLSVDKIIAVAPIIRVWREQLVSH
jgi:transcriptional regulator with XRE-family HTH domain